ncbi:MAG: hypothetical protein HYZ23_06785 [Chloroflexi bacterium]|nr:hypothetical protein [Chloroflexota bacterium]
MQKVQRKVAKPWSTLEVAQAEAWRKEGKAFNWIDIKLGRRHGATQQRLECAVGKSEKKRIPCLGCLKPFLSVDTKRNRMCPRCKSA